MMGKTGGSNRKSTEGKKENSQRYGMNTGVCTILAFGLVTTGADIMYLVDGDIHSPQW